VCQAANALAQLGVQAGDRIANLHAHDPRDGRRHVGPAPGSGRLTRSSFGGFSSEALAGRILDADARLVITADGGYRRGAAAALKVNVDQALEQCPEVRSVVVVRRTGQDVSWEDGRDHWWHDIVATQSTEHAAGVL